MTANNGHAPRNDQNSPDEQGDALWDRRSDRGYGLEYAPTEDTPADWPDDHEPVDDPIGDPREEAFEAAWRARLIDRDNHDKSWRRPS